jgi:hypothetical protein
VVGKYVAEEYDENSKQWSKHDGLNIFITVDVCTFVHLTRLSPSSSLDQVLTTSNRRYLTTITES